MGVLKLDLLLGARLAEVLIRVSLVLLLRSLDSSTSFGTTHKIFLVERVIHVLIEWSTTSCTWAISRLLRWPWVRSSASATVLIMCRSITFVSLPRSVASAAGSCLAASISVLLNMVKIHYGICGYRLIKHAIPMVCILRNHGTLWDIGILVFNNIIPLLFLRRFNIETTAHNLGWVFRIIHVIILWVLVGWDLLDQHVAVVPCHDHVPVVVKHHVLGWHLRTSAVVVVVDRSKVIFRTLFLVICCGRITQLRFVFLVLLDHLRRLDDIKVGIIHVLTESNRLRTFLRNLNLASTHAVWNDVLCSGRSILHVGNLGLCLTSSLSNSLNSVDYFLLILSSRGWSTLLLFNNLPWFSFVDLQFENSVIGSRSDAIWGSSDTSGCLGVNCSSSFSRYVGELALVALWWVHTASDRTVACILVWNLQLLETLIHIRALSVISTSNLVVLLR